MYTHLSETVPQPPEVLLPCEPYPTLKDCVTRTGDQAHGAARVMVICSTNRGVYIFCTTCASSIEDNRMAQVLVPESCIVYLDSYE